MLSICDWKTCNWFRSYLTSRKQKVRIDNIYIYIYIIVSQKLDLSKTIQCRIKVAFLWVGPQFYSLALC